MLMFIFSSVFWEQQGLQTFGQRIQITRPQASQPAFERHFGHLTEQYGYVHAINLLGTKDAEASLTSAYARHLNIAKGVWGEDIGITHYDFHQAVRMAGHDSIMRDLRSVIELSPSFVSDVRWEQTNEQRVRQHGSLRLYYV
jgi:synaptojanin